MFAKFVERFMEKGVKKKVNYIKNARFPPS